MHTPPSWTVLDVSIAMAYAAVSSYGKNSNRCMSAMAATLRGYHSVHPLTEFEIRSLPLLVACRLACSVTLGAYSHSKDPGNEYLLLHSRPAWRALEIVWGVGVGGGGGVQGREALGRILNVACHRRKDHDSNSNSGGDKGGTTVDSSASLYDCGDISFPDPEVSDPIGSELREGGGNEINKETKERNKRNETKETKERSERNRRNKTKEKSIDKEICVCVRPLIQF